MFLIFSDALANFFELAAILIICQFILCYQVRMLKPLYKILAIGIPFLLTMCLMNVFPEICWELYAVFICFTLLLCFKEQTIRLILSGIAISCFILMCDLIIASGIVFLFHLDMETMLDNDVINLISSFICFLFCLSLGAICRFHFHLRRLKMPVGYYIFFVALSIMNWVILTIIMVNVIQSDYLKNSTSMFFALFMITLGMMVQIVFMVLTLIGKQWYLECTKLNEKSIKLQEKHYEQLRKSNLDIRKYRHDIKNHFFILNQLIYSEQYDNAKEYLSQLENETNKFQYRFHSNHDILDAIINEKYQTAKNNNIEFEFNGKIQSPLYIRGLDLCTIFANILDNALEASSKVTTGSRFVHLQIREYQDELMILCQNTYQTFEKRGGLFLTTKEDFKNHGYGLGNIKSCVQMYHGHMNIEFDNQIFQVRIILKNTKN